jgi:hypothetical protein
MQEKEKDFEKLLVEAVDEGLNILSESGKQMVFFHLETDCSISKNDIPEKSGIFADGLEKIFGAGATVLEQHIIKSLYSKLGLKYEEKKDYAFEDYVKQAKRRGKETLGSVSEGVEVSAAFCPDQCSVNPENDSTH